MITEYFFKPSQTVLSASQITEQTGIHPESMDEELLLSYEIFPIKDEMDSKGPLDSDKPVYKNMGTYYLKCPSPGGIGLEEGKLSVTRLMFSDAERSLERYGRENGLSSPALSALGYCMNNTQSRTLNSLRNDIEQLVSKLDENLIKVERAESVEELQQLLDSLPELPKKVRNPFEEKSREREWLFRIIANMIKKP